MKQLLEKTEPKMKTYTEYRELVKTLFDAGESTTKGGSPDLLKYTKLNISRMKRLDKTTVLPQAVIEKVKSIDKKVDWIVLSEGWCGDAAQNLPVINAIAELNDNINLKIALRDENLELMDQFLTNGGRSIPKLLQVENGDVTQTWGPRPSIATQMVADYKAEHGKVTDEFKKDLQVWYNQNKSENLIEDILDLLN